MLRTLLRDATGRLVLNTDKYLVPHYTLLPDSPNEAVVVAGNAQGPPLPMTGPNEGPIELFEIVGTATDLDFYVSFLYGSRPLQNFPIAARTILGGRIPQFASIGYGTFFFPQSLWLKPRETLTVQYQNYSANPNTIRLAAHGRIFLLHGAEPASARLLAQMQQKGSDSLVASTFFYASDGPIVLTAGQILSFTTQISSEAAWELHKITGYCPNAPTPDNLPFFIRMYDYRGRPLQSGTPATGWVHSDLIVGRACFPFILDEPLLFPANSNLTIELWNPNQTTINVWLTLTGRKIYAASYRSENRWLR